MQEINKISNFSFWETQAYLKNNAKVNMDVLYDTITNSIIFTGEGISSDNDTSNGSDGDGNLLWFIIGACMFVFASIGVFIIIKAKMKRGESHQ